MASDGWLKAEIHFTRTIRFCQHENTYIAGLHDSKQRWFFSSGFVDSSKKNGF